MFLYGHLHQECFESESSCTQSFLASFLAVFAALCTPELLEKCLLGATQNRNESFNNLVWARAPKTEFVTRPTVDIAVSQAVIIFNSGQQALLPVMERMKMNPGPLCRAHLASAYTSGGIECNVH